jgi:hypothetical protein
MIHDVLEALAFTAGLAFEPGLYVVIEGQGGSHILMLAQRHHDAGRKKFAATCSEKGRVEGLRRC